MLYPRQGRLEWSNVLWCCLVGYAAMAQPEAAYWVSFLDKAGSTGQLARPENFLSARALERRARHAAPVTEQDLPVSSHHLSQLPVAPRYTSRWLNGALLHLPPDQVAGVRALPGVRSVWRIGEVRDRPPLHLPHRTWDSAERALPTARPAGALSYALDQLRADAPATEWQPERPVRVAVLDGGFYGYTRQPALRPLIRRGGVLATRDFVNGDTTVEELSMHGTRVLTLLAADQPGHLQALGRRAEYLLLRTEDVYQEAPVELYHWVAALEYADSLGVDIVHSSLGYTAFPPSYAEWASWHEASRHPLHLAAALAAERGILLITSSGNGGLGRLSTPADVPAVLAVGAVDAGGRPARFSAVDTLVQKPELSAPGSGLPLVRAYGDGHERGSGTSYSAPLVTSMAIVLMQAYPAASASAVREALLHSCTAHSPDAHVRIGHLPCLSGALTQLSRH